MARKPSLPLFASLAAPPLSLASTASQPAPMSGSNYRSFLKCYNPARLKAATFNVHARAECRSLKSCFRECSANEIAGLPSTLHSLGARVDRTVTARRLRFDFFAKDCPDKPRRMPSREAILPLSLGTISVPSQHAPPTKLASALARHRARPFSGLRLSPSTIAAPSCSLVAPPPPYISVIGTAACSL
ncbi:uncharacterized protein JCM15063_003589 [Sporobolomyces koalae]|uniref:uncharacterized protein n=1 Tax=Sporobolomyces koalae TaxID=500713 RepID=UPI00317DAC56